MLSRNERVTVLNICGAVVRGATVPFPMNGTDYDAIFSCGASHGFGALLCRGLKAIYLPAGIEQQYEARKQDFEKRHAALKKLLKLLDAGEYRYMLLDGVALMGLYGENYERCGKDFNLLVEEEQRERIRYYLQKHGFTHVRECKGANFYMLGTARFCIMSLQMAYQNRLDLWAKAVKVPSSHSAYALSASDRYICAMLKLKQRLDAGFGGVMQLMDVFMLKLAMSGRLDMNYIRAAEEKLGLGMTEMRTESAYHALFLGEDDIKYDDSFIEAVFRDVPTKLPPKYITPERKRFFKRLKIITTAAAVAGIAVASIALTLIFNNRSSHDDPENPDYSGFTAESRHVTEIETAFGYYNGEADGSNVPNGQGTLNYYNGDVYVGSFVAGRRSGRGKTTFASGGSYDGEYENDVMSGNGTMIYASGDEITGEFANNMPNGTCSVKYSDGTVYKGELKDGIRDGEGVFTYSNGDVYEGSFENGFRQGYGEYRYSGGAVYKGNWVDGVQNGDGYFKDKLGEYTGSFSGGVFSGQGTYKYANGDVYTGAWKNGKPHGTGKLTSGGEVYEGSFTNGVINGSGQKTFANGDIVKGTFTNGKLNGNAEYYFKTYGYWRKVLYENGKLVKYLDEN